MKKLFIVGFAGLAVYLFLRQSNALAANGTVGLPAKYQYIVIGQDGKQYNLIENGVNVVDQTGRVWT